VHVKDDVSTIADPSPQERAAAQRSELAGLPQCWNTPEKPSAEIDASTPRFRDHDQTMLRSPPIHTDLNAFIDSDQIEHFGISHLGAEVYSKQQQSGPSADRWHSPEQRVTFSPPCLMMKLPKLVELEGAGF